ncbi:MAG: hypothetical protein Ta2B_17830 [Termitinemataceae bacterium]|nr:MAG: hypothetical protein Ta2B_17830 [Termitinemataceae bacterium]
MIHYDIPEPELSPNFTLDDIHKIREWNYERMKDATREEYIEYMNRQGEEGFRRVEEIRAKRQSANQ